MSPVQCLHWPVVLLCILMCTGECHLYCITPSQGALCPCQDSCITLSEISTNTTYYLDSNISLMFQPGNHNLESDLLVSNITVFRLYSDELSTTSITCTQSTNFHFFEVSAVEIRGLEFIACGNISVIRAVKFDLWDSILISENDSNTALILNETAGTSIVNCSFVAAAMSVVQQSFVTVNNISIFDNRAHPAALTVYDSIMEFIGPTKFMNNQRALLAYNATLQFKGNAIFTNCTTTNNDLQVTLPFGEGGGAISSYLSHLMFQGSTTFAHNRAEYGGAIFAVESHILFTTYNNDYLAQPNSTVTRITIVISNNTGTKAGGGMYLYYSKLTIREGEYHLTGNNASKKGGGIHVVHSYIKLEPLNVYKEFQSTTLMLSNNSAQLGGGVYLEGASKLFLFASISSIHLIGNSADYGAAIYVDDNTKYDTCLAIPTSAALGTRCFIEILNLTKERTRNIIVYNNTAKDSGDNLFGGLIDRCIPPSAGNIRNAISTEDVNGQFTNGLNYLKNISNLIDSDTNSISSHPVRVCFCTQNLPNCSLKSLTKEVQKGQPFNVSISAVDQVRASVKTEIFAYLSSTRGSLRSGDGQLADACTDIPYTVFSSDDSEILNLYADGPCRAAEPSRITVTLQFSPCHCPVGFQLNTSNNGTSCDCICDALIYPEYISSCNIQPEPFIGKKFNFWINPETDSDTNETTYTVGPFCPFGRCRGETRINLNTESGITSQCLPGYKGKLCSTCSENYSLSLGGKRCVRCPTIWPLSFIAIVIGALLAGLGVVISIMAINFTVAVGTINGFIFYANMIDVFDMFYLPFYKPSYPDILIEWLNLDPGIDVCFYPGYDAYIHMWFRLLFPLYIVSILLGIIFISRHSVRFSHFIGNKKPIAVLATLVLLSYTHFLQTALLVLTPSTIITITPIGSHEDSVWFLNGSVGYFEKRHIPLFILGLFILLFAIIYKIIIFSWQWIIRFPKVWILKWTNNQKLNSFIQTYQAPFSDRHRYWTGLLLLVRVLLTGISILTANANPNALLLSIMFILGFILVLRLTYAKNLYKKWPVDLLETVLIVNLFVFTTLVYIYRDINTRRILAYTSITFVLLLLLIVIAYHMYAYTLVGAFPKLKRGKQTPRSNPRLNNTNVLQQTPGNIFYSRDRYHEMIGSIELANVNDHQPPQPQSSSVPAESMTQPKPEVSKVITSSFLDLFHLKVEGQQSNQSGLITVDNDNNFDCPYGRFNSSSNTPINDNHNTHLSDLNHEGSADLN